MIPKANDSKSSYSLELESLLDTEQYIQMFNVLATSQFLKRDSLNHDHLQILVETSKELGALSEQIIPIRESLKNDFEESIFKLDASNYYNKLIHMQ